jgi:ATP-dependent DNA helicase RecQ
MVHIIDVLRGSRGQKVLQFNHDKLSVYSIGKDTSKEVWNAIADRLFELDAIEIGEFRAIKLKKFGIGILQKKVAVEIDKHKMDVKGRSSKKEELTPVEDVIFDKFKALRFDIASKNEIPAYIVFSDKTLLEFAQKLPQTKTDMLDVNGVGEVKYKRYGEEFLALCQELS